MVKGISDRGTTEGLLRRLNKADQDQKKTFLKIASGSRINSASDDPAGLAVVESLESQATVTRQGIQNAGNAISLFQIADGALGQVSEISTRLSELATQSANGTLSDGQRSALNQEFQALTQEISRISQTTTFNGQQLLTGTELTAQVGIDGSASSRIAVEGVDVSTLVSSLEPLDISTQQGARDSLESLDNFRTEANQGRGRVGAGRSRLESTIENALAAEVSFQESASAIRDADIATESANLTANSIRKNASVAVLAQAGRQNAQIVQRLLS